MKINADVKKAIMLGGLCSISYLAVYIARNVLSTVSPQMIESGLFTTEAIGSMSSLYFIAYAIGQLINGLMGQKIKGGHMISFGLLLAGVATILFPLLAGNPTVTYLIYGMTGFFLSMIYAPMTKVVAENTDPRYAPRCALGYTFASLFGSPIAGMLAAVLVWTQVFSSSGMILVLMGAVCFAVFTIMEKRGIIRYGQYDHAKSSGGGIRLLIQHRIIRFTLISAITGVVRTTVVFWLPTYLSQHLSFSPKTAAMLFTVATLAVSAAPFLTEFLFTRLGSMQRTLLVSFTMAAVSFLLVYFVKHPALNIAFMILAIFGGNSAASTIWTRYCNSLRDTGMVSGATGYLDFVSYIAASVSSTLFANAVTGIGWSGLILIWFGLMAFGVCISLPGRKEAARY